MLHPRLRAVALVLGAAPAFGQQFVNIPGIFPGPARWTEGVELLDVDHDGDLDVLFADGDGFGGPGAKRQNVLLINQLVETGSLSFTDESVARLGNNASHAKGLTVADVDGDGWEDVMFTNAFNTDPPHLYINRGAAQPGFFDLESAARGFTVAYSSAGGQFGDVDGDGDQDVILCHSGANYFGGAGASPVLYRNDGTGNFTLDGAFAFPFKNAHMDVQLEDLDLDWDLDCLVFCRADNGAQDHYLLLNDGTGTFTEASDKIPGTSNLVYEADVADLDGDTDHDLFFVSLAGFNEGHMQSELVETGTLDYTTGATQTQGTDDNEVAFVDWNNDGRYDVIIGSLGANERAYRNMGGLVFNYNANRIEKIADSTLDIAIGDIDNNGTYDLVTGQGESGNFTNKAYDNTGDADDVAPVVVDAILPGGFGDDLVAYARVRDQVRDDATDYVTGRGVAAEKQATSADVDFTGGVFAPAVINVVPGQEVVWDNLDGTSESVTSTTDPWDYDLALPAAGTASRIFVTPGTYDYVSSGGGATGQVVVAAGTEIEVDGDRLGGEVHRIAFGDPGAGATYAAELFFTDYVGNESVVDGLCADANVGTNYCQPAVDNSTGNPGAIAGSGSTSVVDNDFHLQATDLPTFQPGYFIGSENQGFVPAPPGSEGNLCLGAPIVRFISTVQNSGGAGEFNAQLDLTNFPGHGQVMAGETWNFQAWYRDNNPGQTSNFTDGLEVPFN